MRKYKILAAMSGLVLLAACTVQDRAQLVDNYRKAQASNNPAAPTAASQQQPQQLAILPDAAGVGTTCSTMVRRKLGGVVISGGETSSGQFFACKAGTPLHLMSANPEFNAKLISYACDMSKPVVQTKTYEGTVVVNCTYAGPDNIPPYILGVKMLVVK